MNSMYDSLVLPTKNSTLNDNTIHNTIPFNENNNTQNVHNTNTNEIDKDIFELENVMVSLKVIAQLTEHKKLRVYDETKLDIDNRIFQTIRRPLSGDGQNSTLEYIKKLVRSSKQHSLHLLNELVNDSSNVNLLHKLDSLTYDLKECLLGLNSLSKTYYDPHFLAELKLITDNIGKYIEHNQSNRNNICN